MPISKQKTIEGSDTQHYVSERKKRGQEEPKLQPPLTPMIDVTFQLLLYFLLTSKFREDEGVIPGSLPQKTGISETTAVPLRPVQIILQARGAVLDEVQYEVDNLAPTSNPEELFQVLLGKRGTGSEDAPVVIRPDTRVRWKYVVEVFNAAVRAKFKNIGFASAG